MSNMISLVVIALNLLPTLNIVLLSIEYKWLIKDEISTLKRSNKSSNKRFVAQLKGILFEENCFVHHPNCNITVNKTLKQHVKSK